MTRILPLLWMAAGSTLTMAIIIISTVGDGFAFIPATFFLVLAIWAEVKSGERINYVRQ